MEQNIPNRSKHTLYKTFGTCSQFIEVETTDGIISYCHFHGGCDGNTKGLARMVTGMRPEDVISRLSGITCGRKSTSCPDQLCHALKQLQDNDTQSPE